MYLNLTISKHHIFGFFITICLCKDDVYVLLTVFKRFLLNIGKKYTKQHNVLQLADDLLEFVIRIKLFMLYLFSVIYQSSAFHCDKVSTGRERFGSPTSVE